ncbi:SDR family oxidoreductase [Paenibacillus rigui]|uniref:Short-chain dehydrogenase n=1 Tax=Paenibacillus rigui TaxID=554312 RepID=A0A229UHY8_9BACL|nr:SDR family oxidoreductase [Paenibacillus rigui]OXM83048.1 short-chain dehydrogenase [Paenibacillus rigui]
MGSGHNLSNKIAVVTGGTGLLGKLYCRTLAQAGARVIVADLCPEQCQALASEINQQLNSSLAIGMAVDLSDETSICSWAKQIKEQYNGVDIIVNNAACKSPHFFAPLESFPLDDWNQVMSVNVTAMFLVIRELGPSMVAKGKGAIVNISSIYGLVGPDQRIYEGSWHDELQCSINTPLVYSVTKGAVISLTRYLATYWGPKGVRVNTLTPGGVFSGQNDLFHEKYSFRVPLGRMAQADEMSSALLFLVSDASSYVNGHNLVVDGGWTAW